jgi:uncharacterized protein YciI
MKILILITLILGVSNLYSQNDNPNYDSTLAVSLDADDYGMKAYVLVMLTTGSNTTTDKEFRDSCFRGHFNNISRLVNEGKLIIAGPIGKNDKSYRGIFVLNVKTLDEANELLYTDPAVKAKFLNYELYNWYGSAALSEYLKVSDKIWKKQP